MAARFVRNVKRQGGVLLTRVGMQAGRVRGDFVGARCAAATYPTLMKKPQLVAPAKAGAQCLSALKSLDPGLRRGDGSFAEIRHTSGSSIAGMTFGLSTV